MSITIEEKVETDYRTYQIRIKSGHRLHAYFAQLTLQANNLYNTTNFYIRQVYTGLTQEKPLQDHQQEVLTTIRETLDKMNDSQLKAYQKKVAKEKTKPVAEHKEVKANLFAIPSKDKPFLGYNFLDCLFKTMKQPDYTSMPGQVNQQVMKNCLQNWSSFFEALKGYKVNPSAFTGRPQIPAYLPKGGQKEVTLSKQVCALKDGHYLRFPKTKERLNIGKVANMQGTYQQTRVIPKQDGFVVEVIFKVGEKQVVEPLKKRIMGIDLGVANLATVVTNTGMTPALFKGGYAKSVNQWYNKQRAYYMAALRNGKQEKEGQYHSKRLQKLDQWRENCIKDDFHKISCGIVCLAVEDRIDTIVIGHNQAWKQEIELGKRNNQNFVFLPHARLIQMIQYKAEAAGIAVIVNEESYTSKASCLDNDTIPTFQAGNRAKHSFSGRRIKRGLYKSKTGILVNADVNGAGNIIRKVSLNAFGRERIAALCVTPLVVNAR